MDLARGNYSQRASNFEWLQAANRNLQGYRVPQAANSNSFFQDLQAVANSNTSARAAAGNMSNAPRMSSGKGGSNNPTSVGKSPNSGNTLPNSSNISSNTRKHAGSHQFFKAPETLPAFAEAIKVKSKTSIQGGGGLRRRWKDKKYIYEWDSQHGTVEKYNKNGKHLGEFDAITGKQLKPADAKRRVEP